MDANSHMLSIGRVLLTVTFRKQRKKLAVAYKS